MHSNWPEPGEAIRKRPSGTSLVIMSTKCFNVHVTDHIALTDNGLEMFNRPVEFVWLQGVVTMILHDSYQFNLDDGTSNLMVLTQQSTCDLFELSVGDYVLVQGSITKGEDEITGRPMVALEARIISPIKDPNMETLWFLEVKEAISRSCS